MKRRVPWMAAMTLLIAGFVGGYLVNASAGQGSAAAESSAASRTTAVVNSTSGSSIDVAIEAAYQKAQKSVVFVKNGGLGTGSGIVYDTQGDIVTNDHVVAGGKSFSVTFWNGARARATLVGADAADDLAVLRVNATGLYPATFVSSASYRMAETVLALGSPLGLQRSVTQGLISGLNRTEQEPNGSYIPDAIQTSAAINPGNSGGALVDLNGDVVGVPTIVQTMDSNNASVQNIGFAIPSSRVSFIVPQLIQYGKVIHTGRAFLGVSVGDSAAGYPGFFHQGNPTAPSGVSGAVVQTIKSGGPAAAAGLRTGDVITRFNGRTVTSSDDLLQALAGARPGQSASVTYQRSGSNHDVQVRLGELPATQ